ncbi:MAG: MotA/TolQ/ExbB proton channel family protein [Planctomycetaceae bacterium]|nr:MotA/TolQ/ExbB proton channel family protein [Planctomycetaceae bacterium]
MNQKLISNNPRMVPLLPTFIYGTGAAFLLFGLIRQGWVSHPILDRYVMAHPVSIAETIMFAIGLMALILKGWQVRQERKQLLAWESPSLAEESGAAVANEIQEPDSPTGQNFGANTSLPMTKRLAKSEASSAATLAQRYSNILAARPLAVRTSSIGLRTREALQYIKTRQSAHEIDSQLKHLANREADAQHESYSLIRLMVWAIPMLGFLGTVLGISEALGGLNLGAGADLSALITSLKSSLYVAFDTTAIALTYGVCLMFVQFGLDRVESANVSRVDALVEEFILTNFQDDQDSSDSPNRAISRMGQALLQATFSLVEHQHELWNESLTAAQEAWVAATENSTAQSEKLLQSAMSSAGQQIAERLSQALDLAEGQLQHRAQQWQVAMSDNTRVLAKYQENAATHVQLLDQFFQQCSHLSKQQQDSITDLIQSMNRTITQNQEVQARWQEEQVWQKAKQQEIQAEMESMVVAHATEVTHQRAMADARIAAEVEARMAAEQRAHAEAEARLAAEGLVSAETSARRIAEQQAKAASEAQRRAEELARAATVARKLAERQLVLESENRQLRVAPDSMGSAAAINSPVVAPVPHPTATVAISATKSEGILAEEHVESMQLPPVDWHLVPGRFNPTAEANSQTDETKKDDSVVSSQVRSSILPFPDAKIYRAA